MLFFEMPGAAPPIMGHRQTSEQARTRRVASLVAAEGAAAAVAGGRVRLGSSRNNAQIKPANSRATATTPFEGTLPRAIKRWYRLCRRAIARSATSIAQSGRPSRRRFSSLLTEAR